MIYQLIIFASAYGANPYDTGNYNGTGTGAATSGGGAAGGLSNTGTAILAVLTLAAVILLVAMVVRIWKRPSKPQVQEEDSED